MVTQCCKTSLSSQQAANVFRLTGLLAVRFTVTAPLLQHHLFLWKPPVTVLTRVIGNLGSADFATENH